MPTIISPDYHIVNPLNGLYEWSPQAARRAWELCYVQLEALWQLGEHKHLVLMVGIPGAGKSTWLANNAEEGTIYWDACFPDHKSRHPVIEAAREYGMTVGIVWLDTPINTCVVRNSARSPDRQVPLESIHSMHERLLQSPPDVLTDKVSYVTRVEYKGG